MTTVNDVGWGSYSQWEGVFFRGSTKLTMSNVPSDKEKYLQVFMATESGGYADPVNGYDRMILSAGAIQFAEGAGLYLVSDLLGAIATRDPALLAPLQPALDQADATFQLNSKGRWRFHFNDARGEVDTVQEQHALFQLHSDGTKGSWDDESKAYAKVWAASVANVLAQPDAHQPQVEYTVSKLTGFLTPDSKAALWGPSDPIANDTWVGALRAGYLSFAGNLPATASAQLKLALASVTTPKWSQDWCIGVLKQLTFGPNIAIYPARYDAIRPVIERLYGVNLPDFAAELKTWQQSNSIDVVGPGMPPTFTSTTEVQTELMAEGYDLGPSGADGQYGAKTKDAVLTFQRLHGLSADGVVGNMTRQALVHEWESRTR